MFVGREKELKDLNQRYASGKFELAAIYGRRRIGKTTLLNEFIKGKECIYYTCIEMNDKQNLYDLSQSIYNYMGAPEGGCFESYDRAFEAVFKLAAEKRILFIIDEYPYLANENKSVASVLQRLIDKNKATSKLFLVLCGSSMSFMEEQFMNRESPLYGRRTCQYKIKPFDFWEAKAFCEGFSPEDLAVIYGITGGIPLYLAMMDGSLSLKDNICKNFLQPASFLYEEPSNLIKQECRDASTYNSIIAALAGGATRISEISDKAGVGQTLAVDYLRKLIGLGIVKKETPYGIKNSKKTIYTLEDTMFRFWYRFIPSAAPSINRGLPDRAYKRIEPHLPEFMGPIFEDICKQYLWRQLEQEKCPVDFIDVGRWWGTDPIRKCPSEIDIMGDDGEDTALFAECKWRNELVDISVFDLLRQRSSIFDYKDCYYYLFSKSGFTQGCYALAEQTPNVQLVDCKDIFNS